MPSNQTNTRGPQDFGEKIGGARKDLWRGRGLMVSDLTEMSDLERTTHIKKENIWPRPDWERQVANGKPQALAYWQNKMRQSIPPRPPEDTELSQRNYIEVVGALRDAVMSLEEPYAIDSFYKNVLQPAFVTKPTYSYYVQIDPAAEGIVTNKVLKAAQSHYSTMKREAEKKLFAIPKEQQIYVTTKNSLAAHLYDGENTVIHTPSGHERWNTLTVSSPGSTSYFYLREGSEFYDPAQWEPWKYFVVDNNTRKPLKINFETQQEAQDFIEETARERQRSVNERAATNRQGRGSQRKKPFAPPQLRHIHRTGPNYRHLQAADSKLYLDDLKFRGGEFGNWLNQEDRQTSLNMGYDALRDLARILHIRPEDVSLNGNLAIAFGARGTGGAHAAAAHYEPGRQVINLTKMSGAGCLAHEWAHALDHAIGISAGETGLASECKRKRNLPKSFLELLSAMQYKTVTIPADKIAAELAPKVSQSKKQLTAWINSVKPNSLPNNLAKAWDDAAQAIVADAASFTGGEYIQFGSKDPVLTKPEIEILSQIRKSTTNHAIPRATKRQIAMWAYDLKHHEQAAKDSQPQERTVKTDFYTGSIAFDGQHSRAGHGYYQSTCEMFARAFDCYISDKLKEEGNQSDYLSAHANAFVIPGKNETLISAIPQGEERTLINEKFDILIRDLKELGLLQEYTEVLEESKAEPEKPRTQPRGEPLFAGTAVHSEQISFDDLLFSAQERATAAKSNHSSREISQQGRA